MLIMMLLIERSEYDDDDVADVADRKVKVLIMMLLIEISKCDADDVAD